MPLSISQIAEFLDHAERFVGAFVKCGSPGAEYSVCGIPCYSLEEAIGIAMVHCPHPSVDSQDKEEQKQILREGLRAAIEGLDRR